MSELIVYGPPCENCGEPLEAEELPFGLCIACAESVATDSPDEEDYVIADAGYLGSQYAVSRYGGHGFVGEFSSRDEVDVRIRELMEAEGFYPNVWVLSDHGNWIATSVFPEAEPEGEPPPEYFCGLCDGYRGAPPHTGPCRGCGETW